MVDTTIEKTTKSNLSDEAKALSLFIQEQGLRNLTLVGNSQGGAEAIHLIALLQEQYPEIEIGGLVLFDPVTLTQQTRRRLFTNYVADILKTNLAVVHHPRMGKNNHVFSQNMKYIKDGITEILGSVINPDVFPWPKKVWNELTEMAKQNPDLGKIKCPVILFQGEYDRVSDPRMTAPKNSHDPEEGYIEDLETRETRLTAPADQNTDQQITTRENYLRKTLFPNSPYVRMVVPRKMGYHNFSYSRPDVAKASLYLLGRFHREQPQPETA
jgi:pimeloyl-ACP methyl ester carboxylesterase